MKYENAKDILPEHLLEEIQKYAAGRLIYVPTANEHRNWGENSGIRERLKKRNVMIQNKYAHGITITELAEEYYLSLDSIKKIIYSANKKQELIYENRIASAVAYSNAGLLEEWMQTYFLFTNKGEINIKEETSLIGVVKIPLRIVHMSQSVKEQLGEIKRDLVGDMDQPLILLYQNGKLQCPKEQEDAFIRIKQSGREAYPAIIMIPEKEDFVKINHMLGNVLFYMGANEIE